MQQNGPNDAKNKVLILKRQLATDHQQQEISRNFSKKKRVPNQLSPKSKSPRAIKLLQRKPKASKPSWKVQLREGKDKKNNEEQTLNLVRQYPSN